MAYNNGLVVGGQIGVREELADYIAVVDAKSTPLISMAPKGKDLGNQEFSWQLDYYASPKAGGTADGADVSVTSSDNASAGRARYSNVSQVFRRVHRTGFIAETSNVAGVTNETARAVMKRVKELKRDMESTFACVNQALVLEDNTPTAALTASLGVWMNTTNASGRGAPVSGSQFVPASGAVTTTTTANTTETTVQNVLTAIYGNTGTFRDYDGIFGTTLKRAFTLLTAPNTITATNTAIANAYGSTATVSAIRTFNMNAADSTYTSSVDIFKGDFGSIRLHPTTFIGTTNGTGFPATAYKGYVIPMEMLEVRYAKLPEVKDLPDAGGGPIKLVQAIAGLVVKNPAGFGMFNGAS